jgi:hypothetical protein
VIESRYAADADISVLLASGRVRKTTDGTRRMAARPEILMSRVYFLKSERFSTKAV